MKRIHLLPSLHVDYLIVLYSTDGLLVFITRFVGIIHSTLLRHTGG